MTDPYVWMSHPTLPGNDPVQTPRGAFEAVYQHLGWELADTAAGPSQADLDATLRPPPEADPAVPDAPASTGGRPAARGKAGPSKVKE
jgi:hypothetical protein